MLNVARHSWMLGCRMVGNIMWNIMWLLCHTWTGCACHSAPWLYRRSGKHLCCSPPAQTFHLSGRERKNFLRSHFMNLALRSSASVLHQVGRDDSWDRRCTDTVAMDSAPESWVFLPFPTLLHEIDFPLAGLMTKFLSVFGSGWKQSRLSSVRIPASKQNKSHWWEDPWAEKGVKN